MNIKDFKFLIRARKIPVVDNPIIEYVEDKRFTRLLGEIYYKEKLIAKGVILNFYKEFDIIDNETKIRGFINDFGKFIDVKTRAGQLIFEIKYYKNPPLKKEKRKAYINELVFALGQFINIWIWENDINVLTYIPSSSKIPDDIAYNMSKGISISLKKIITKKSNRDSKNISINDQIFNRYEIDFSKVDKNDIFVVIDDVVGTGASFCEVMYKLNRFNNKVNYFLAVAKDVKR